MSEEAIRELARRINEATPEEIVLALKQLPTDAIEVAVRFEALGQEPHGH